MSFYEALTQVDWEDYERRQLAAIERAKETCMALGLPESHYPEYVRIEEARAPQEKSS